MCVCVCVKVKVAQSCLTLCDSMNYTARGILQARILEWVAFPFSRDSPGDLLDPGIEPWSPALQAVSLPTELSGKPICVCVCMCVCVYIHTYHIFFIHLAVDEHIGCFHVLAIVNCAAKTLGCIYLFKL